MRRIVIGILVIALLAMGGGIVANLAYQAGLSTAITTVAADAPPGTIVTPVVPGPYGYGYGYGYGGWHGPFGFGLFGFFGFLLVLFLVFALIRAFAFRGGRGWGPGGPGGWGGPGGSGKWAGPGAGDRPWERHARDTFESWHRESHGDASTDPADPSTPRT